MRNSRPNAVADSQTHPLPYVPFAVSLPRSHPLPITCDMCVESVTFTDEPDHTTNHDTPNPSSCLHVTPEPYEICVESETFADIAPPSPRDVPPVATPETCELCVESETFANKPDRHFSKGLCATPAQRLINPYSLCAIPDALPFKRCDTVGQSETFADVPDHNLNSEPRHAFGVRSLNPRPMPDPPLSETCEIYVENETFADIAAPNPHTMSSAAPPNRKPPAPGSMSPATPDTREICVESETLIDKRDHNCSDEPRFKRVKSSCVESATRRAVCANRPHTDPLDPGESLRATRTFSC